MVDPEVKAQYEKQIKEKKRQAENRQIDLSKLKPVDYEQKKKIVLQRAQV